MEVASEQHRKSGRLAHAVHLAAIECTLPAGECTPLHRAQLCAAGAVLQACTGSLECQAAVRSTAQALEKALTASASAEIAATGT